MAWKQNDGDTMSLRHLQAIIFDADHTLYTPRSEEAYSKKFQYLADETGVPRGRLEQEWEHIVAETEGSESPGKWERKALITTLLENVGIKPQDYLIDKAYDTFWERVVTDLTAPKGLVGMLHGLKNEGYRLAIATDEYREPLEMKLQTALGANELEQLFQTIVTPDEAGRQKPAKSFYEPIIDAFDIIPDEAMMVGDSWKRDLKPAKEMGLHTVLVGEDVLKNADPDYHITEITELEDIIHGDD